jgi:hypothetical protein
VDVAAGSCGREPGSGGARCTCFDENGDQCTSVTACAPPEQGGHHQCLGDCLCLV